MIKTSKEFAEWLGLQVGDKVKFLGEVWTVMCDEDELHKVYLHRKYGECDQILWLTELIDRDIELLPQQKHVGDLKCKEDFKCEECPLRGITHSINNGATLYSILALWYKFAPCQQEIYSILKAKLDKEVQEYEDS